MSDFPNKYGISKSSFQTKSISHSTNIDKSNPRNLQICRSWGQTFDWHSQLADCNVSILKRIISSTHHVKSKQKTSSNTWSLLQRIQLTVDVNPNHSVSHLCLKLNTFSCWKKKKSDTKYWKNRNQATLPTANIRFWNWSFTTLASLLWTHAFRQIQEVLPSSHVNIQASFLYWVYHH